MNSLSHKTYLEEAFLILESEFPKDWLIPEGKIFNSEDDFTIWLVEKLYIYAEISQKIDFSIISGEYINNDLREILKKINSKFKSLIEFTMPEIPGTDDSLQLKYFSQFDENFIKPFVSIINSYSLFLDTINRGIKFQNHNSVLFEKIDDDVKFDSENDITFGFSERYKINIYNLELAKIDFFLKVDEQLLSRCLLISKEIEKLGCYNGYIKILVQKANYLAYKILYRFEQDEKTYTYRLGFSVEEINKEQLDVEYFKYFKDFTENHYDEEKAKNSIFSKKRIEKFYNSRSNAETLEFIDYHAVTKLYKDYKKNIERLKNLETEFVEFVDTFSKNSNSLFDRKAIAVSKQYIHNNLVSLEIEKNVTTFQNFNKVILEIETNNESTRTNNYFPFYKIALLIKKSIDSQFDSDSPDLIILKELLIKYDEVIRLLIKSIDWCEKNCFLAFQLPFQECLIRNEDFHLDIFLSSNFVLPINYPKLLSELKILESQILKFDTMYNIQKSISKQEVQIEQVRHEAQKYERRGIEILSVFAAIGLFVSGNIQVFTKVETFDRALQFMLVFAYAMGLFVFLIWFISRPDGVSNTSLRGIHWVLFGIFLFATIAAILVITGLPPFDKLNEKEEIISINKRIDSAKMNIDTLVYKNHLKK